jgi:hypothetical protein
MPMTTLGYARTLSILLAVTLLIGLCDPGRAASGFKIASSRLELGISTVYDNNILRYSDKYITRYGHGEDPGRFHISGLDDMVFVTSIKASATAKILRSLNTTGTIDLRQRSYMHNNIKDWSYLAFSLRQDLSKKFSAQIGYSYIPAFYVRHFRDDDWAKIYGYRDPVGFQPFGFQKDEVSGWLQYSLLTATRVRVGIGYGRYFYNEHFTEYDCANTSFTFTVFQALPGNVRVTGEFDAVYSRGDGTTFMNPSYDQNVYGLDVVFPLPNVLRRANALTVSGEYSRSCFTSTHFAELDPNHAGREDRSYRFSTAYSVALVRNFSVGLAYAWQRREVRTGAVINAQYLSEEKDFHQFQFALDVKYTIALIH